jgi:hypothetical protein
VVTSKINRYNLSDFLVVSGDLIAFGDQAEGLD